MYATGTTSVDKMAELKRGRAHNIALTICGGKAPQAREGASDTSRPGTLEYSLGSSSLKADAASEFKDVGVSGVDGSNFSARLSEARRCARLMAEVVISSCG